MNIYIKFGILFIMSFYIIVCLFFSGILIWYIENRLNSDIKLFEFLIVGTCSLMIYISFIIISSLCINIQTNKYIENV